MTARTLDHDHLHHHHHHPRRDHRHGHDDHHHDDHGHDEAGPVVLDIGGDRGALVVALADSELGSELHVRPVEGGPTTHTGVLRRATATQTAAFAVFPELGEGRWHVLTGERQVRATVVVTGGTVAELDLR